MELTEKIMPAEILADQLAAFREKDHLPQEQIALCRDHGVLHYRFAPWSRFDRIEHAFFTRIGGVSPAPFDSLNVCRGVGDDPRNVIENRGIVSRCMQGGKLVFIEQVHGIRVAAYSNRHPFHAPPAEGFEDVADAMVTDIPGIFLTLQVADCQPVFLVDPVRSVVAAVHSGWRGSIGNIAGRTVHVMVDAFGCRLENIFAGIGPSLGPCCAQFVNYRSEIPEAFWKYKDSRDHFDFWAATRDQLCTSGLSPDSILASHLCTRCGVGSFFSYRAQKTTGRLAAAIGVKQPLK